MPYFFYILGVLPSLIWLLFYLRKDKHPESNWMVASTFFMGMASALLILVLELIAQNIINLANEKVITIAQSNKSSFFAAWMLTNSEWVFLIISIFFAGSIIEEYIKYRAVKFWALKNSEFDEPIDIMLYMIIGALGFAAMENIMVLHNQNFTEILTAKNALLLIGQRFVLATFLHALCSGIVGFFLAWSIYKKKFHLLYFSTGLLLAIVLHGVYNWVIMEGTPAVRVLAPFALLILMSAFVSYGFSRLKELKAICLTK